MAFDGLVMAAIKHELNESLVGGRVEKIYQPLSDEIILIIHKDRNKYRLLISANSRDARVHITETIKENPLTPPLFCMVLRKHLEGGKITSIRQSGLDRILHIIIESVDELGMLSEKELICEVMGKHSNIILVDPAKNLILDGINRYSYATSRHREVLPGRQYASPPPTGKINPKEISEDTFLSIIWNPDSELQIEKILLLKVDGLSPQTCREVVARAGLEPGISAQSIGEFELHKLWQSFSQIQRCLLTESFEPSIYYKNNYPFAYSAIGLTQFGDIPGKSGTMNKILDEYFSARQKQEQLTRFGNELTRILNSEIKKCQKKISIHQETLENSRNAETFKIYGELITANIYRIAKGEEQVELENYYDPEQKTVTIELDSRLTPAENAQLYYKRYTKARHSHEIADRYLEELNQEISYLESVVTAISLAERTEDLIEIKAELIKENYVKPETIKKNNKRETSAMEPLPLSFQSGEGFKILVGRNNRQNDNLTMKLSAPDDLWLHVKDIPGSHVVIKNPEGTALPDSTIQKAAETAAFYSKARLSSKVPVDFTLRKHVRKPRGAKPGMVIYDNQTTVIVEPKAPE